ncbi:MAG: UDP-N-acetylmuramate dehydrogenase [Desulfatibacillaceae bacterium]|nr:UDP-N-acetylmuramate dehydrogenase [Desulfatibacillaceae bacterium]
MEKAIHRDFAAWLVKSKALCVRFDEPMSRHTTLGVGGPAEAFVVADTKKALAQLVQKAGKFGCPWQVLGKGSNVLVGDEGLSGLVIKLGKGFGRIRALPGNAVFAGASVRSTTLCRYAVKNNLDGFQVLAGIPGTVGGALWGNAGTSAGHMGQLVQQVLVMDSLGAEHKIESGQICWGYRSMALPQGPAQKPFIIIGAWLGFCPAKKGQSLEKEYSLILETRKKNQPAGSGLAGCFFKNPPGSLSAGALIDRAGLKGFGVGDAVVSSVHANFFVNRGNAKAADFIALMEKVAQKVRQHSGISLEPEVRVLL